MTQKERGNKIAMCTKDIIFVKGTKYDVVAYNRREPHDKKKVTASLFNINGKVYILASNIHKTLLEPRVRAFLIQKKLFKQSDFLYAHYTFDKGGSFFSVLVDVKAANDVANKIGQILTVDEDKDYTISLLANVSRTEPIEKYEFSDEEIELSKKAYVERLSLVAEKKNSSNRFVFSADDNNAIDVPLGKTSKGTSSDEKTLKALVKEIERMGWQVTLTLKS